MFHPWRHLQVPIQLSSLCPSCLCVEKSGFQTCRHCHRQLGNPAPRSSTIRAGTHGATKYRQLKRFRPDPPCRREQGRSKGLLLGWLHRSDRRFFSIERRRVEMSHWRRGVQGMFKLHSSRAAIPANRHGTRGWESFKQIIPRCQLYPIKNFKNSSSSSFLNDPANGRDVSPLLHFIQAA